MQQSCGLRFDDGSIVNQPPRIPFSSPDLTFLCRYVPSVFNTIICVIDRPVIGSKRDRAKMYVIQ